MERKTVFEALLSFRKVLYLGSAKRRSSGEGIKRKHITGRNSSLFHNFRKCKEKTEDGNFPYKDGILNMHITVNEGLDR